MLAHVILFFLLWFFFLCLLLLCQIGLSFDSRFRLFLLGYFILTKHFFTIANLRADWIFTFWPTFDLDDGVLKTTLSKPYHLICLCWYHLPVSLTSSTWDLVLVIAHVALFFLLWFFFLCLLELNLVFRFSLFKMYL